MNPNARIAMTYAAALAMCAPVAVKTEREAAELPPEPEEEPKPYQNLPGETNRQLAARLKAQRGSDV